MAEPKFDFDFGDLPKPPAQEGTIHKLMRWATDPIADSIPGLKNKLEQFAQPGLNDSPTKAKIKGFLAGAGEAVKPGHLAALATLPAMAAEAPVGFMASKVPGLSGTVGNVIRSVSGINQMRKVAGAIPAAAQGLNAIGSGAMGIEGAIHTAQDASDPNKGKLDVAKDVLDTGLGALGGVAGIRGFNKTRNLTKALGDVQQTHDLASQKGLRVALDDIQKTALGAPTTADEITKQEALYNELKSKPGGKIADAIFGEDKGVPKDPSHVELTLAHEKSLEDQAGRTDEIKKNLNKGFMSRVKERDAHLDAAQKDIERAGTQEEKNYKAGQKYIEGQGAQDTRNEKAARTFQEKSGAAQAADIKAETKYNLGQAKATEAAGTQNTKLNDQAIAQSDAERQANAIEGLKDRLTEPREPSTIRETVSGPGEHGGTARATFMRTEPPPPEDEGTVAGAIGGKPVSPQAKTPKGPATSKGFNSPEDAQRAVDATGGAFSVAQNPNDGLHYMIPEGKQPPWNNDIAKSLRPYSQLTAKEQKGINPLLQQALAGGVSGDHLEQLGDDLANKLSMVKEGRAAAADSNSTLDSAISAVKKSGPPIFDDGTEEIGKFKQFLKQNGISPRGILAKTGKIRSLDQAGQDLKGTLAGFENGKESSLIDHLQTLGSETKQTPVEELVSKHKGNWWEPKPTAEVQDDTKGEIPTVDVEPPAAKGPRDLSAIAPDNPMMNSLMDDLHPDESTPRINPEGHGTMPAPSEASEPEGNVDTSFDPTKIEAESPDLHNRQVNSPFGNGQVLPSGIGPTEQSEMQVPEFAQALSEEGKKPLAELPQQTLRLTGEQAPKAPDPSFDFDVRQTPNPDGTTTFYPEPKALEAPTEGLPVGGAIPARGLKPVEQTALDAGNKYGMAKYNPAVPEEELRTLGKQASQTGKQAFQEGGFNTTNPQIEAARQELTDPQTDPLTKSMLQRWLDEQGASSTSSALRLGAGTIGGLVGYQQDPLGNRPASALAGGTVGFFSPEIASSIAKLAPAMGEGAVNRREQIANVAKTVNQFHNTALLSPLSVAKKAAGDVGGLTLAALEHKERTGDILKQFLTQEGRATLSNNFKEGFYGPDQERLGGLDLPNKILNSNANPMSWSGKVMGGLTKATKGVLGEAGFSPQEQRYYTLTDYPQYKTTEHLYNAIRQGDFLKHLVPFARVGINRLERGYEYSPIGGLANLMMKSHSGDPGGTVMKAALGTAATAGAYNLTPEDFVKNHPIAASVGSSLAGPLGLPVLAGMALKNAHQKQGDPFLSRPSGSKFSDATQEIARDVPGLRIIEDISGKSPTGFARNYLSGYTNVTRLLALGEQYLREGNMEDPDLTSKDLTPGQQIYNRALSNIPGIRETLPKKEVKITSKPKFDFKF